ncbi:MAG: adenylate/guanylate cyclase domain-containing protein, partial [Verrucomicrobiaceae bacterium]
RIRTVRSGGGPDHEKDWLVRNKVSRVPAAQEVAYMVIKPDGRFQPPSGDRSKAPDSASLGNAGGAAPETRLRMFGTPLREVIITPIKKPGSDTPLGALIVGLPVSNYGESALYDLKRQDNKSGDLFTGQWIDDQLFSWTIPEAAREPVSQMARKNLALTGTGMGQDGNGGAGGGGDGSRINIDGKPYQILLRSLNTSQSTPAAYQITLFSLAGLEAQKKEVRLQVIGYSALAFAAAMLLSWLLARRLVNPVQALVEGTRKIKNGEYDTRVEVTTRDELADLASSFNEMAEGLRQRERYRDILFQVSDDDIARKLIETACLGGERREISVLFCDIRSFTATTNGMAPEGIIDMLNEHMTALTAIVHKHHGVVDKFVGDLIMAIFGAPKSYGDDAGNAAACALEMVARREELNETTAHPPLLMGIGIASGTAVAGCMGSEHRLNYTVLGEPVNLASRLCSAAGPREVILDPHTVSLLGGRAVGHQLKPLLLKGFPEPVPLFHLTRLDGMGPLAAGAVHPSGVGTAA